MDFRGQIFRRVEISDLLHPVFYNFLTILIVPCKASELKRMIENNSLSTFSRIPDGEKSRMYEILHTENPNTVSVNLSILIITK